MNDERRRWNAKYEAGSHRAAQPTPFLATVSSLLPARGRALDVAGGAGRNAIWLARRGLDVTVADVSDVGLDLAQQRARADGVPLATLRVDLQRDPLPGGWDVIVSVNYLQRGLFTTFPSLMTQGGMLVFVQPTVRNLERHQRPPRRFLLEEGELETLVPKALTIVRLDESWSEQGHHEARLLARHGAVSGLSSSPATSGMAC